MELWVILFIVNLLIPLTMLLFGTLFYRKAPSTINHVFGYRTKMSMKNKNTWNFAHRFSGKLFIILGAITLLFSFGVMMIIINKPEDTICKIGLLVSFIEVGILIFTFLPTEVALRKKFDKYGKLK